MPVRVGLKFIEEWKSDLEKAICDYEKEPAEQGKIVFYGPSNFTRWSEVYKHPNLKDDLLGKSGVPCCINRGFGSSNAEHQLYYYARMVRPLAPKVLVYSFYGNYRGFGYSMEEVWELAQRVIAWAKADFPDIRIYLLGAGPSKDMTPSDLERAEKFNSYLQEFVEKTPDVFFLNVMDCKPLYDPDNFVSDGVHFNARGYAVYADFFRNALKDELACY